MKRRDFTNDSILNICFRIVRGLFRKIRGKTFYFFGMFSKDSSSRISISYGSRFINSRSITLHKHSVLGLFSRLECYGKGLISIGENSSCGDYVHVGAVDKITIGSNVLIGSHVLLIDHNHGNPKEDIKNHISTIPKERILTSKGPITINDNVWIGDNVVVLSGVTIGKNSIIAAGSIITKNVLENTLYIERKL